MIILTEEQKLLLKLYEGGRYRVIQQLEDGIEFLKEEHGDIEMIENMEILSRYLQNCNNKEFFEMKKAAVLDIETEGESIALQRTD